MKSKQKVKNVYFEYVVQVKTDTEFKAKVIEDNLMFLADLMKRDTKTTFPGKNTKVTVIKTLGENL